jgi:hypothetical protein
MAHVQEGDFCLQYLLSEESWRITLPQKTMVMDFCVVFCAGTIWSFQAQGVQNSNYVSMYVSLTCFGMKHDWTDGTKDFLSRLWCFM